MLVCGVIRPFRGREVEVCVEDAFFCHRGTMTPHQTSQNIFVCSYAPNNSAGNLSQPSGHNSTATLFVRLFHPIVFQASCFLSSVGIVCRQRELLRKNFLLDDQIGPFHHPIILRHFSQRAPRKLFPSKCPLDNRRRGVIVSQIKVCRHL